MTTNTPGRYGARPYTDREMWGAFAFLLVFGLPFAAGGVWALASVPAKWASGHLKDALLLGAAGLAFALVGLGLMAGSLYGRRKVQVESAAAFAHPDEPWKWRPDWAQGHALDGSPNEMWAVGAFALLWNLVAFPGGVLAFAAAIEKGQPWAGVALLFPATGLGLVLWTARAWFRFRRYGVSRFDLASVPVPLGRTLSGTVHTRLTTPPADGFQLTLSALRTTRSGPDNDVSTRVVWQEEAQAKGHLSSDGDGVRVVFPVAIRIPTDAPSTDHSDASDELAWKLEVRAKTAGLDYRAAFEVPVYRTEESALPERAAGASHLRAVETYAVPAELAGATRPEPRSAITVERTGKGLAIEFPAARNPGIASGVTAFWALWTGAIVFMMVARAPWFFPLVFGLFDLLFGWIVLTLWLEVVRLSVGPAGVEIASGLGTPGASRLVLASDVEDVRLAIGMTSGTTAYYDLKLIRRGGGTVSAGGGIRHKHEAEWIAAQIKAALPEPARSSPPSP